MVGLFLGGYPTFVEPTNKIYLFLKEFLNSDSYYVHALGCLIFMFGITYIPTKNILNSKIVQYLGKISLGIFIVHTFVIRFFAKYIGVYLINKNLNYCLSFVIILIISTVLLIIASDLYNKYIYSKINEINKKIYKLLNIK